MCDSDADLVRAEELGFVPRTTNSRAPLVIPASAALVTGSRAIVYVEQPDLPEGLEAVLREGGLPMNGGVPTASAASSPPAPEPVPEPVVAPTPDPEPEVAAAEPMVASTPEPTPEPEPEIAAPELTLDAPPSASDEEPEFEFESPVPEAAAEPSPVAETPASAADEDPEKAEERERAERLARIAVSEMLLYQPEKFEQATRDGNLEQVLDLEIQEARALLRQRISEEVRAETDFVMDELERVAAERSAQG